MKTCRRCSEKFDPARPHFVYCRDCIATAYGCRQCKKPVFPNADGNYSCCGVSETADHVRSAAASERVVRSEIMNTLFPKSGAALIDNYGNEIDEDFPND